jgi:hypothetical protein
MLSDRRDRWLHTAPARAGRRAGGRSRDVHIAADSNGQTDAGVRHWLAQAPPLAPQQRAFGRSNGLCRRATGSKHRFATDANHVRCKRLVAHAQGPGPKSGAAAPVRRSIGCPRVSAARPNWPVYPSSWSTRAIPCQRAPAVDGSVSAIARTRCARLFWR